MLSKDEAYALGVLLALKAERLRIFIEDFARDYSSLSYLLPFPVDKLKIDRSFIIGLEDGGKNAKTCAKYHYDGAWLRIDCGC